MSHRRSAPISLTYSAACLLASVAFGLGEARAQGAPPAPPVQVSAPLAQRVTNWDEFTGRFEASEQVEVRARVSGFLDSIHFKDGDLVKKGDLLFTIDPRPYRLSVDAARAEVARAKAQVELAQNEVERAEGLTQNRTITARDVDQRRANLNSAIGSQQGAEANLKTAELNLEWTEVRAPLAGRISNRQRRPRQSDRRAASHGATLLDDDRRGRSDLLHLRRIGGRLPALTRACSCRGRPGGRHALRAKPASSPRSGWPTSTEWTRHGTDRLRRQHAERALGHDPRPRRVPQRRPVPDAGHLRAAARLRRRGRRPAGARSASSSPTRRSKIVLTVGPENNDRAGQGRSRSDPIARRAARDPRPGWRRTDKVVHRTASPTRWCGPAPTVVPQTGEIKTANAKGN